MAATAVKETSRCRASPVIHYLWVSGSDSNWLQFASYGDGIKMGKLGYFAIVIGIAMFFTGLFGTAVTVNPTPVPPNVENVTGGLGFRTLYLYVVTPVGLLMIAAGTIFRLNKRSSNQRRAVRIAQAVEASHVLQDQISYPQFEGLLRSLPNAEPSKTSEGQNRESDRFV